MNDKSYLIIFTIIRLFALFENYKLFREETMFNLICVTYKPINV